MKVSAKWHQTYAPTTLDMPVTRVLIRLDVQITNAYVMTKFIQSKNTTNYNDNDGKQVKSAKIETAFKICYRYISLFYN